MSERNDNRLREDMGITFVMYCDTHGLTLDEGRDLADRLGQELEAQAEDRVSYLKAAGAS